LARPLLVMGLSINTVFYFVPKIKGVSFTYLIVSFAITALIYPSFFLKVGSFDMRQSIIPLLMIIMFGMEISMSLVILWVFTKWKKGVLIGLICQFSIVPLLGFVIATYSRFPKVIAARFILVGASPNGLTSNVMSTFLNPMSLFL
jgi:BASS family bile acid:Na+ symporter